MVEEKHALIKENEELRIKNDKLQAENQKLQEKMNYMMEVHRKECDEMKHYVDKTTREAEVESEKKMFKIMEEQERRYNELKQHGREMIKAFAKYI